MYYIIQSYAVQPKFPKSAISYRFAQSAVSNGTSPYVNIVNVRQY